MNRRPTHSADPNRRAPALPPRARWALRLLVGLPLTLLLVASAVYFAALGRLLRANLAPVVAGEASRQIGHEVLLGGLQFRPGVLVLDHVAVSNYRTFRGSGGEAAVVADRVTVHYSLHDLLFDSGNAGHAFGDIVVDHPTVLAERRTAKTFNFSDVIDVFTKRPSKPHAKLFAGRIIVHDATAHYRDYTAPAGVGVKPAFNTVTDVNATVDLGSARTVYFTASGRGTGGRVADFAATGDASRLTSGRFRVFAHVNDGDAAYWSTYFKAFPQAIVKAGRADLDLTVARLGSKPPPGLPIDLLGRVVVRRGVVALTDPRVRRIPLQNVNGTATFTGDGMTVEGTLLAAGQFAHVSGSIFGFQRPQLAFDASSPRLDAVRVGRLLPMIKLPPGLGATPAPVTAQITGTTVNPVVSVQTTLPAMSYRGNMATDVRVRALYAGQVLAIPAATFQLNGTGQGAVRVIVNTAPKTPTVLIGGRLAGVNLAALRLPVAHGGKPLALGGTANVAFLANDQKQPLSVVANVSVDQPRVAQTRLRSARGRLVYSAAGGLTLSRAVAETGDGGVVSASGTIPLSARAPLNLAVNATGANLSRLLSPYTKLSVGGTAYAQARVAGPLSAPQVSGRVQLFGGRFGRIATDVVTGSISGSTDAIHLQDVVVRRFPTEVRVSGTVSQLKSQNPALALQANLSQGDLADVLSLAEQVAPPKAVSDKHSALGVAASLPALTGTVQGSFQIAGRLRAPQLAGHVGITDATVDAYRVRRLSADVAYAGDTIRVADARLQTDDGASLAAHGQFQTRSGQVNAVFAGKNIDLDQFDNLTSPYATVDGLLDVTGRVGGTLKSPTGAATVSARDFTAEGQSFAPFTVAGRYADGVLSKTGGPWTFTLQTPGADGAQYVVDSLRLSVFTAAHPKRPQSLTLAARIPESAPERLAHLAAALQASRFARTVAGRGLLAQLDALPAAPEGAVWVPSVVVDGPFAAPTIQATLGGSDLSIGENRIGTLAARASYAGGASPAAHGQVTAQALQLAGVPLQSLTAQGDYAHRVISNARLDARSEQAYLHASGRADLDGAIDAGLDASNVPLSLANLFLPPGRRVSGTLSELTVQATGQTRAPDLTASVNIDRPTVTVTTPPSAPGEAPTTVQYALDDIRSGTLTLSSPQPGSPAKILAVTDLAAFRSGKRLATLSGTLPLAFGTGAAPGLLPTTPTARPLHADLQVADLGVVALFAPGLIDPDRTHGALTATLDYGGGTGTERRLLGQVNITNASLGIGPPPRPDVSAPPRAAGSDTAATPPPVVRFDTSLTDVNGRLAIDGNRLTVQSFTAHTSADKKGTLTLTGGGLLGLDKTAGRADLRLVAKNVRVDETGRQNFLAKTYNTGVKGTVNGAVTITGPWDSPLIATAPQLPLQITDAVGTLPSASNATEGTRTAPTVDPRFDISVALGTASKTVSVRSSLLQAEASGNVHLTGSLYAPQMRARVVIARGQFILPPTTRLKIIRPVAGGNNFVSITYPAPATDPTDSNAPTVETRVDLTAQANVAASPAVLAANQSVVSGVSGQAPPDLTSSLSSSGLFGPKTQRYTITVHITGLLNSSDPKQPLLQPTSDPPGLLPQQMLALLVPEGTLTGLLAGGQGAEVALKQSLAEAFSAVAVPTLLSPLEESVAGALGLQDFSVDYSPDAPVNVTLSKEIAPRLLATYIRAIGSRAPGSVNSVLAPPQYQIKLGYGLTNHIQVSVSTDDQHNDTLALESIFRF